LSHFDHWLLNELTFKKHILFVVNILVVTQRYNSTIPPKNYTIFK